MANASDIITFIGVPLAVLGVLPIIYTALNSLLTVQNIKRKLKQNGLQPLAITSSLMSGIVEVTLPRFSITPLDRDEDPEYRQLNPNATKLRGGTWTIFNWNRLATGSKMYRLQYSSDLQVPQAEISLEELVSFLMDLGAVPDVKGLRLFRASGLWTPVGTSLMLSPDTTQSALRISVPDDSEGVVSLAISWKSEWGSYRLNGVRPGWMRVKVFPRKSKSSQKTEGGEQAARPVNESCPARPIDTRLFEKSDAGIVDRKHESKFIGLRFGRTGRSLTISNAFEEVEDEEVGSENFLSLDFLDKRPLSIWVPAIALALGIAKSMPLYNHGIDESLLPLALRDTIPCGVLVMLGILDEADAPSWETKYDRLEDIHATHTAFLAQQRAIAAERLLPADQAAAAAANRRAAEFQHQTDAVRGRLLRDKERREKRAREAIASVRIETLNVAHAALKWLQTERVFPENLDLQGAIEFLLVDLLRQDEGSSNVCDMLEDWKTWNSRGGMTIEDIYNLSDAKQAFCKAACVMGLIKEVATKEESAVAEDIKACVRHWKKVRLG